MVVRSSIIKICVSEIETTAQQSSVQGTSHARRAEVIIIILIIIIIIVYCSWAHAGGSGYIHVHKHELWSSHTRREVL
jgi:hypothetical protein